MSLINVIANAITIKPCKTNKRRTSTLYVRETYCLIMTRLKLYMTIISQVIAPIVNKIDL